MAGSIIIGLVLATAGMSRAATLCVNASDPACASTIQAAVDVAVSGDQIEIASGFYGECVSITTPGVALRGRGSVLIDPSGVPERPNAVTVAATDVTLEGLAIRNGEEDAIHGIDAAGIQIVGVDIQSPDDHCIRLVGQTPRARLERSRLRGCKLGGLDVEQGDGFRLLDNHLEGMDDSGARIAGDGIVAEGNVFSGIHGVCLDFTGRGALAVRNRFRLCRDGISITGDAPVVEHNDLVMLTGDAIAVSGAHPVVERNRVEAAGSGIRVRCASDCGGRVVANRLVRIRGIGINARPETAGLVLRGNRIQQTLSEAIEVAGSGVEIEGNYLVGAGSTPADCMRLTGDANRVFRNEASACSRDAISLHGNGNVVDENHLSDTGDDGIDVASGTGNVARRNRITDASDNGIEISAAASVTLVSANRSSGLRAGYCDGGVATRGGDVPDSDTGCGSIDD